MCLRYLVKNQKYKPYYMRKLYFRKSCDYRKQPKQETIQFLVNFSKSLKVIKTKSDLFIELNLN